MNTKKFISDELDEFIKIFSKTRVRYEFDKEAMVHVVEILPNSIYHLDNEYIKWENNFFNRFVTLFPKENICFISDDAVVGIEHEEYVKEGLDYAPFPTTGKNANTFSTIVIQNPKFEDYENVAYSAKEPNNFSAFNSIEIPNTYLLPQILQAA